VFVTCACKLKETTSSTHKNLILPAIHNSKSSEPLPVANLNNGKPCLPSNKMVCAVTNYKDPNKVMTLQYNIP
jgi:hypothetical protein